MVLLAALYKLNGTEQIIWRAHFEQSAYFLNIPRANDLGTVNKSF